MRGLSQLAYALARAPKRVARLALGVLSGAALVGMVVGLRVGGDGVVYAPAIAIIASLLPVYLLITRASGATRSYTLFVASGPAASQAQGYRDLRWLAVGDIWARLERQRLSVDICSVDSDGRPGATVSADTPLCGPAFWVRRPGGADYAGIKLRLPEQGGAGELDVVDDPREIHHELAQFLIVAIGELLPGTRFMESYSALTPESTEWLRPQLPDAPRPLPATSTARRALGRAAVAVVAVCVVGGAGVGLPSVASSLAEEVAPEQIEELERIAREVQKRGDQVAAERSRKVKSALVRIEPRPGAPRCPSVPPPASAGAPHLYIEGAPYPAWTVSRLISEVESIQGDVARLALSSGPGIREQLQQGIDRARRIRDQLTNLQDLDDDMTIVVKERKRPRALSESGFIGGYTKGRALVWSYRRSAVVCVADFDAESSDSVFFRSTEEEKQAAAKAAYRLDLEQAEYTAIEQSAVVVDPEGPPAR